MTTDEVVHGDEELAVSRLLNLVGCHALAVLDEFHLANLVLVEVLHLLHTRNLARVGLHSRCRVRYRRRVDVVVLCHRVKSKFRNGLLIAKFGLHERIEREAVKLELVVLQGHRIVEESLKAFTPSRIQSAGEKVVELYCVSIHIYSSYPLKFVLINLRHGHGHLGCERCCRGEVDEDALWMGDNHVA